MSIGKWLLGGLGFVLGGPIGAVIGIIVATFIEDVPTLTSGSDNSSGEATTGSTDNPSGNRTRVTPNDIKISILVLAACVMKADGHVKKTELEVVKDFLRKNYGEQAQEALQILKKLLESQIDHVAVSQQIRQYVNYSTRLTILQFLVNIAIADGEINSQELSMVEQIALSMGISQQDFDSIVAIYKPRRDANWAYTALEIEVTATDDEVKKAYRKMAMKYHPDKVASAGDDIKQKANEKFRAINEAYEHIKLLRGMK